MMGYRCARMHIIHRFDCLFQIGTTSQLLTSSYGTRIEFRGHFAKQDTFNQCARFSKTVAKNSRAIMDA